MKKISALIIAFLFAFSLTAAFAADKAADTKAAPVKEEKKAEPKKAADSKHQLKGEVKAVDAKAATVTVKGKKEMTFTAEEKMLKDVKVGDSVVVTYTEKDGKATATGIKAAKVKGAKKADKKVEKKEDKKEEPAAKPAEPAKNTKKKKSIEGC
jgi:ribosomal protein S1